MVVCLNEAQLSEKALLTISRKTLLDSLTGITAPRL